MEIKIDTKDFNPKKFLTKAVNAATDALGIDKNDVEMNITIDRDLAEISRNNEVVLEDDIPCMITKGQNTDTPRIYTFSKTIGLVSYNGGDDNGMFKLLKGTESTFSRSFDNKLDGSSFVELHNIIVFFNDFIMTLFGDENDEDVVDDTEFMTAEETASESVEQKPAEQITSEPLNS